MAQCKNKGCTGHTRRGQFYCYDCYQAWLQGGDEAVATRIAEMQQGEQEQELEELRAFKQKVFDAVLPPYPGLPTSRKTEQALFETIHAGHYTISKLRKEWYNNPDFDAQNVPKHGPGVRAQRARLMVDWYIGQLDKVNKPRQLHAIYPKPDCSVCGLPCYERPVLAACPGLKVQTLPHPSAKVTDESAPLRQKVAELEGRLALSEQRSSQRVSVGIHNLAIVAALITGAVLAYWIK